MYFWKASNIAELYKGAESVTGPFAKHLIRQAGLLEPSEGPLIILDNACGTGIVTSELHDMLDEGAKERLQVTCGDLSEAMVHAVQQRIEAHEWKHVKAQLVNALSTGLPSDHFTHVLSNFAFLHLHDASAAFKECFRILKSGGACALSTWETRGWVEDARAAIATIPGAPPFPDTETFVNAVDNGSWNRPDFVREQLANHGFEDIKVEVVPNSVFFENVEVYMRQFSGIIPTVATEFWDEGDCAAYGPLVAPAVLEYLKGKYGVDEVFELKMVAIIATARKP